MFAGLTRLFSSGTKRQRSDEDDSEQHHNNARRNSEEEEEYTVNTTTGRGRSSSSASTSSSASERAADDSANSNSRSGSTSSSSSSGRGLPFESQANYRTNVSTVTITPIRSAGREGRKQKQRNRALTPDDERRSGSGNSNSASAAAQPAAEDYSPPTPTFANFSPDNTNTNSNNSHMHSGSTRGSRNAAFSGSSNSNSLRISNAFRATEAAEAPIFADDYTTNTTGGGSSTLLSYSAQAPPPASLAASPLQRSGTLSNNTNQFAAPNQPTTPLGTPLSRREAKALSKRSSVCNDHRLFQAATSVALSDSVVGGTAEANQIAIAEALKVAQSSSSFSSPKRLVPSSSTVAATESSAAANGNNRTPNTTAATRAAAHLHLLTSPTAGGPFERPNASLLSPSGAAAAAASAAAAGVSPAKKRPANLKIETATAATTTAATTAAHRNSALLNLSRRGSAVLVSPAGAGGTTLTFPVGAISSSTKQQSSSSSLLGGEQHSHPQQQQYADSAALKHYLRSSGGGAHLLPSSSSTTAPNSGVVSSVADSNPLKKAAAAAPTTTTTGRASTVGASVSGVYSASNKKAAPTIRRGGAAVAVDTTDRSANRFVAPTASSFYNPLSNPLINGGGGGGRSRSSSGAGAAVASSYLAFSMLSASNNTSFAGASNNASFGGPVVAAPLSSSSQIGRNNGNNGAVVVSASPVPNTPLQFGAGQVPSIAGGLVTGGAGGAESRRRTIAFVDKQQQQQQKNVVAVDENDDASSSSSTGSDIEEVTTQDIQSVLAVANATRLLKKMAVSADAPASSARSSSSISSVKKMSGGQQQHHQRIPLASVNRVADDSVLVSTIPNTRVVFTKAGAAYPRESDPTARNIAAAMDAATKASARRMVKGMTDEEIGGAWGALRKLVHKMVADIVVPLCPVTAGVTKRIANNRPAAVPIPFDAADDALVASMVPKAPNAYVVDDAATGYQIRRQELETCNGKTWLNDQVINYYGKLVSSQIDGVCTLGTFFFTKLDSADREGAHRWLKRQPVFSSRIVLLVINRHQHWTVCAVDNIRGTITYYDSMGGGGEEVMAMTAAFFDEAFERKFGMSADKRVVADEGGADSHAHLKYVDFQRISPRKEVPQQQNYYDCGVFTTQFCLYAALSLKMNFKQEDIPYLRKLIVVELLSKKLMLRL